MPDLGRLGGCISWTGDCPTCGAPDGHPCRLAQTERCVWRRAWIALQVGRRTWGWWPLDWRRSFFAIDARDRLCIGLMVGVSDD